MKVVSLDEGKLKVTEVLDFLSGVSVILFDETVLVKENRQSINFTSLTLDGDLKLDGDLWLA